MDTVNKCRVLLEEYRSGKLGVCSMPEDSNPGDFTNTEERLAYFTLPMALNYQRNSYGLWQAALNTYRDVATNNVFNINNVRDMAPDTLREKLLKHKLALQPNKHTYAWQTVSTTVFENWGSFDNLFNEAKRDFLQLQEIIQHKHKKDFPYLSGPKIFNYWSFIISTYGGINLKNKEFISIAPDTHIIKASIKLGAISQAEADKLTRDQIAERWRILLAGSGINPIDMHPHFGFGVEITSIIKCLKCTIYLKINELDKPSE